MCTKCLNRKLFSEYAYKDKEKTKLKSVCKKCTAEYANNKYHTESSKIYREKNKESAKQYNKQYNLDNREKLLKDRKKYYQENKKNINDFKRIWANNRRKKCHLFKLTSSIKNSIFKAIKNNCFKKDKNTLNILGCTFEEFKQHIESQFLPWMSWSNYGNVCETLEYNCSWDLDHIIPISWAKTIDEVYCLNHWSNFQPLCSKVNRDIKKANIYPCCNIELNITVI